MIDHAKIDAILANAGKPKRVPRPHRHFDGEYVDAPFGRVAYAAEGFGPAILLVHGWEGSQRDLQDIATALSRAGARVVAMDLPAHGFSEGETLSNEDAAVAILALDKKEGPFAAVVAHSFGCPSTVLALEAGLKTGALVFFAPPANQVAQFRRMAGRLGLNEEEAEEALRRVRENRPSIDDMDLVKKAAARREPLLVIHSADDEMTPLSGAREIADAWPGGKLIEVDGLGHNLTMRDSAMVAATVRFALG